MSDTSRNQSAALDLQGPILRSPSANPGSRLASAFRAALITPAVAAGLAAQDSSGVIPRAVACDGLIISTIEIRRSDRTIMDKQRAPGWSRAVLQPLLLGVPTRASAVTPFVQLKEGAACTEQRRSETERLLRLQPYLADAAVRVFDESDGRVRVVIETVDDIRPIVGLSLRDNRPVEMELGNANIAGTGQLAAVRWRDGQAFRDGFGVRYANYHLLGGANIARVDLARTPLGSLTNISVGRPFYTDLQHVAGYVGYLKDDGYSSFDRVQGDAFSIATSRERADVGMAMRLNPVGRVSYLLGGLISHERRDASAQVVRITDAGLVDTTDAELTNRFATQKQTRVGVVLGVRALKFAKVRAFDGLESVQDVGRGLQWSTTVGKGVSGTDRSPFVTADVYTGVGGAKSFVGLRVQTESRQKSTGWGDGVVSGRLAWYRLPTERQTSVVSVEFVGSSSDSVPYMLSIADVESGVRGYSGSRLSGGRRLIVRGERRVIMPGISRYLGWGLAAFADGGQMWAGRVPFGTSAFRSSVGIGVLAAVPRASRSLGRIDIAYPIVADKHAKGVDIRVTFRAATRAFWREPLQIARARLARPTTDIFTWP